MSKKIPLTQGKFAIVDDEDYDRLNQYKWQAVRSKSIYYAMRVSKQREAILMHREILGLKKGDGKEGDHQNVNSLDNRKANLRICTRQQNCFNALPRKGTTSRLKGVCFQETNPKKPWRARITYKYKTLHIGYFAEEEEAGRAYDKKAKELFGKFALTNFSASDQTFLGNRWGGFTVSLPLFLKGIRYVQN